MHRYSYNRITKELEGALQLHIDPLESKKAGKEIYVIPPFTTNIIPPEYTEHKKIFFDEKKSSWYEVDDYRGVTVYDKRTGEAFLIQELGPIPDGYSFTEPIFFKDLKDSKIEEVNVALNDIQKSIINCDGFKEDLDIRVTLAKELFNMNKDDVKTISDKDGTLFNLTYDEVSNLCKFYMYYDKLVHVHRSELIKEIKKCRSKEALDKIKVDFNLTKRVKDLMKLPDEEVEEYFKNQVTGG